MTHLPDIGGGGGGGGSDIIWQWDGTLDDFTDGADPEVEDGASGVLSIETSFRGNPALRMTALGAGNAAWAIDPTALGIVLPRRFTIEYEIEEMDDGVGAKNPASQMGIMPFCQYNGAGDILGYGAYTYGNLANTVREVWIRNTTIQDSGGTPIQWRYPSTSTDRGMVNTVDVEMILGATFDMSLKASSRNHVENFLRSVNDDAGGLNFDAGNYDNETPNTIGLGGLFTAVDHFADFTRLTLKKHPADRT